MKKLRLSSLFYLAVFACLAQNESNTKDASSLIPLSDFSRIFTCKEFKSHGRDDLITRREPIGYFGDNYQRIFIHFLSAIKNNDDPKEYFVHGKSKLKKTFVTFRG